MAVKKEREKVKFYELIKIEKVSDKYDMVSQIFYNYLRLLKYFSNNLTSLLSSSLTDCFGGSPPHNIKYVTSNVIDFL